MFISIHLVHICKKYTNTFLRSIEDIKLKVNQF